MLKYNNNWVGTSRPTLIPIHKTCASLGSFRPEGEIFCGLHRSLCFLKKISPLVEMTIG